MDTVIDLGKQQWFGRGLDGRTIRMRSKVKNGVLILKPSIRDWREWIVWASGKAQYYESRVLNALFGATTNSLTAYFPATIYFGLWRSALSASSTGSTANEVTTTPGSTGYAAYARVSAATTTANFPASATGSAIQNASAITFGTDASGTPTIISLGILDAATTGNLLYWCDITSITLAAGETPQININGLSATEA